MKTVKVRNITIGEGVPKICVPITGTTQEEIVNAAYNLEENPVDLVLSLIHI